MDSANSVERFVYQYRNANHSGDDGKYQAKSAVAKDLGMKITLEVQGIDGDDAFVELSPLEIQIKAIDGREPVEGLDLNIGKPIISTRSLRTTAKIEARRHASDRDPFRPEDPGRSASAGKSSQRRVQNYNTEKRVGRRS